MSLNIKNERVHALAREAARITGKTQTGAIQEALERLLAERETEDKNKIRRMKAAAARWRETVNEPLDSFAVDDLYDDDGLPR